MSKVAVICLSLLPLAWAQESDVRKEGRHWTQEISGSLENARNLHVTLDMGTVRVEGGSQQGIRYVIHTRSFSSSEKSARRGLASYKVSAYVRGDTAFIAAEFAGKAKHKFSGEFVVTVPRALELVEIHTGGGGVTATGINGTVHAESGGGAIRVEDVGGSVTAQTGGERVEIGNVGGDVKVHSGGGRVAIGAVKGSVNAYSGGGDLVLVSSERDAVLESGAGDIQVQRCGGHLRVETEGGNISLGDVVGPVDAETGGGSIRLASAKGPVQAETGAGRIELDGIRTAHAETGEGDIVARLVSGADRSDSSLETAAGDVRVFLVSSLNVTVRASIDMASGHTIRSDFPEIRIRSEGEWGPRELTAEGSLNGGGPLLKIRTTTGNIVIVRSQ